MVLQHVRLDPDEKRLGMTAVQVARSRGNDLVASAIERAAGSSVAGSPAHVPARTLSPSEIARHSAEETAPRHFAAEMAVLVSMGFSDSDETAAVLAASNGDVGEAIAILTGM